MNVIVAFPKAETGKKVKTLLTRSGYHVTHVVTSGGHVLTAAMELRYGIVVCAHRLPDMLCNELIRDLPESFRMVALTGKSPLPRPEDERIVTLVQPLQVHELLSTLEMVSVNVTKIRKQMKDRPRARSEKEEKAIRAAKQLLMERNHMTEDEAHRYIQKTSMNTGNSLVETAQMILDLWEG